MPRNTSPGANRFSNMSPQAAWQAAIEKYQNNQPKQARELLKNLVKVPGADGNVFLLAGLVEAQLSNWQASEDFLNHAISLLPNNMDAKRALANVFQNSGRAEQALPIYQFVVQHHPDDYQLYNNMAVAFEDIGYSVDALECYQKSLSINPDFELALRGIAPLFGRLRKFERACEIYEKLIARFPEDISLQIDFAEFLEQSNQPQKAKQHIPVNVDKKDKVSLARIGSLQAQLLIRKDRLNQALEQLRQARAATGQEFLLFREGMVLDRLGNYELAIKAFKKANKAVSDQRKFKRIKSAEVDNYLQQKISRGIPKLVASPNSDTSSRGVVFLVGLPRSGTTLVNRILNAHPSIQVLEELEALRMVETSLNKGADVEDCRRQYWEIVRKHIDLNEQAVVVDKSPYHAMSLDTIARVFGESTVLMMLRHPYDSALSCFMQDFNPGPINAQFLELRTSAEFCGGLLNLMSQFEQARPENTARFHYEALVKDFSNEVARLLDQLGLKWHEDINRYDQLASQSGPIMTASYEQVTRKIYHSAIYRWHNYRPWLEGFDQYLGPWLEGFGYSKE